MATVVPGRGHRRPGASNGGQEAVAHRCPPVVTGPVGDSTPGRRHGIVVNLRLRVAGDPWLYAVARVVLVAAVPSTGACACCGAGHLPATGPAIVVANHPSDVDPILLARGAAAYPPLHGRRRAVPPRVRRADHRAAGGHPDPQGEAGQGRARGGAGAPGRRGGRVLFAEGDLYRRAEPAAFHSGVAFLAVRSGAPVVPVAISGAERLWAGGRVHWPWIPQRGRPLVYADASRGRVSYARIAAELHEAVVRSSR